MMSFLFWRWHYGAHDVVCSGTHTIHQRVGPTLYYTAHISWKKSSIPMAKPFVLTRKCSFYRINHSSDGRIYENIVHTKIYLVYIPYLCISGCPSLSMKRVLRSAFTMRVISYIFWACFAELQYIIVYAQGIFWATYVAQPSRSERPRSSLCWEYSNHCLTARRIYSFSRVIGAFTQVVLIGFETTKTKSKNVSRTLYIHSCLHHACRFG